VKGICKTGINLILNKKGEKYFHKVWKTQYRISKLIFRKNEKNAKKNNSSL